LLLGRRGRGSKPAPVRFAAYRGESLIHCHYANLAIRSDSLRHGRRTTTRDLLRDGSKRPLVGAALGLLHGVFAGTRAIDLVPIVHPDSAVELSWLLVLVRASDMSRTARVVLTSGDRRIELPPLRFSRMGDPDTWSSRAPPSLDSITSNCSRRSGELLASGSVSGD
jgi:hypothetical protein